MQLNPIFEARIWAEVPDALWSGVFFVFGCMVGSFLNVCIHRMPRGESIVSPPSHCPHCRYSIPWFLNIPLLTWVMLGGKCRNCRAPISIRYFLVELTTGLAFLGCWLAQGRDSALVALVFCLILAGLIVATAIDFEHLIIPDEITLGGMVAGFLLSALVPALHGQSGAPGGMAQSFLGLAAGVGTVGAILQIGKWVYGRQLVALKGITRVHFLENCLRLPDRDIPYEDVLFRASDAIRIHAERVEMVDRCYWKVPVSLAERELRVGEDRFDPEQVKHLEVWTERVVLPREAMGMGDVKFMGAIGAFLGWKAVFFSLMVSALIGSAVGLSLIGLGRREWSSRLPYGPYIALATVIWMFWGRDLVAWWAGI